MYTKYFGFNEKPFTLTPNPRFIYLSKNHKEAFAHLLYGINNHYGFIELIGEVGTGKTTVLRTLLGQLQEENYRSALIFNTCVTSLELLRSINQEFGIRSENEYTSELLAELNRFLLAENARGVTVLLVIDEAQNLQPEVLEQLRLISNLETDNDKLIQIILAGQPELEALLAKPELRQLNQRIAVRYRLKPMSLEETRTYIRHRMTVAGETGGVSFSRSAIRLVHLYSRGVPRTINNLCDRALLIAYGDEHRRVTSNLIVRAIGETMSMSRKRRFTLVMASVITMGILCSLLLAMNAMRSDSWWPQAPYAQKLVPANIPFKAPLPVPATMPAPMTQIMTAAATPRADELQLARLEQEILSHDQNDAHIRAFNALAVNWGARPITIFKGKLSVPRMFSQLANKRNLRVTIFKGTLAQAIQLGLPFLLETRVTGSLKNYCIAVTAIDNNSVASISPPLSDRTTLSVQDLKLIASGTFYLVWRNSGQIPNVVTPGVKGHEVRSLQQFLTHADSYHGPIDGTYGTLTVKAVRDYQQSIGIPFNETVGELTLAALSRHGDIQNVPSLASSGRM